ncbi:DUF222 domain-containing protein [Microbacterium sp. bgisy203]|uniref:HNH endonuclease signature motif containing protein n=1 Tax=Microbacterium sp. bgisy203 TaxID=3413799 RepID=UPI003D749742
MSFFTARDPHRDPLLCDPELRDAYVRTLDEDAARFDADHDPIFDVDEDPFVLPPDEDEWTELDRTVRSARALAVAQDVLFHEALERAAAEPDAWVGPDPTLDRAWRDPRGRSTAQVRDDRRDLAVRAAAADVGARVRLSDNQVRGRAHRAATLSTRTPLLWERSVTGAVSEANVAIAYSLATTLPDDDPDAWAAFDSAIHLAATTLTPGRFRQRARAARERAHRESATERHTRAAADRRVDVDPAVDGMAYLTALIPAAQALAIDAHLDEAARDLASADDETRTKAQLRADAFVDLLTRQPEGPGSRIGATVHVTIPALALVGRADEPATLAGYGPIDLDTAREMAGGVDCITRVLTDPFTGTVLDVERRSYRLPADLKRFLRVRYPTCVFPGCLRPSSDCDMDHRKRWTDGGSTSAENIGPLCPPHHRVEDETLWRSQRDPDTGTLRWTSPSGFVAYVDPPPF